MICCLASGAGRVAIFLGSAGEGEGGVGAVSRASVRAAPPWQAFPETQWLAGTLPQVTSHKYLAHQGVVSTPPSLPTPLKVGTLPGRLTPPVSRNEPPNGCTGQSKGTRVLTELAHVLQ